MDKNDRVFDKSYQGGPFLRLIDNY